MAYILEFFESAENDLEDALDWYLENSPTVVQSFFDKYLDLLDRISETPQQFPKAKGIIRKARFPQPFPYNFQKGNAIFIIAVFHDKRNPKIWKKRTK